MSLYHDYKPPSSGITILYGSETGNAEEFARYLYITLRYLNLAPVVMALDEYPLKKLVTDTRYLIVICSTSGQGDLPRNARSFMRFILRKKLPSDLLNHIQMTTLGLGDSSYSKFNHAIRKLHIRLSQLGCTELSPRAEADEMSPEGSDGFYKAWEMELVEALKKQFPERLQIDEEYMLPPEKRLDVRDGSDVVHSSVEFYKERSQPGILLENTRVTATDHFQDVRYITVESPTPISYAPGDCAALYPINDDASVELMIQAQPHWIPVVDKPIATEIDGVPSGTTLRDLLTQFLDISAVPRRSFFRYLWHYVDASTEDGQREQEKMKEFAGLDDVDELYNYANRPRRSILETVLEFQGNLQIPVERVLELFPRIRPRLFSIASKPDPRSFSLVVGVVEYKTMLRRIRRGLCTRWLKNLAPGAPVLFDIVPTGISYGFPILMVAAGTGIAPMKAVVEKEKDRASDIYLFYGCRHRQKDFLFEETWNGVNLFPCFSRDGDKVRYVQDKLYAEKTLVAELLVDRRATVFVCGSSGAMPKQVKMTLAAIVGERTGEEGMEWLVGLEDEGRYIEDTW